MEIGIFVGRVCPPHIGHMRIIDTMISECGEDASLIFVGSAYSDINFDVLFTLEERMRWLSVLYGDTRVPIMPMADTPKGDDARWFHTLESVAGAVAAARHGSADFKFVYYGGSDKCVKEQNKYGRTVRLVPREKLGVSGTDVRMQLAAGNNVSGLVDRRIIGEVLNAFPKRWEMATRRRPAV